MSSSLQENNFTFIKKLITWEQSEMEKGEILNAHGTN